MNGGHPYRSLKEDNSLFTSLRFNTNSFRISFLAFQLIFTGRFRLRIQFFDSLLDFTLRHLRPPNSLSMPHNNLNSLVVSGIWRRVKIYWADRLAVMHMT